MGIGLAGRLTVHECQATQAAEATHSSGEEDEIKAIAADTFAGEVAVADADADADM